MMYLNTDDQKLDTREGLPCNEGTMAVLATRSDTVAIVPGYNPFSHQKFLGIHFVH